MLKINYNTLRNRKKLPHIFLYRKFDKFLNLKLLNKNVFLAGGSMRFMFEPNEKIVDFDLFFTNELAAAETCLKLEKLGAKEVFVCPLGKLNTFKYKGMKIQVIKENYYPDIETLLSTFDIRACRIAYYDDYIYIFKSTISDIRKKHVNLHAVTHPNATFKRMLKYRDKGYTITNEAIDRYTKIIYNMGRENLTLEDRFYID